VKLETLSPCKTYFPDQIDKERKTNNMKTMCWEKREKSMGDETITFCWDNTRALLYRKRRIGSLRWNQLLVAPHLEIGYFPGIAETESVVFGGCAEIDHLAFV